jgi:hypothetical protein
MSVAVRHPDADPATRNRGDKLRHLGGLGSTVITTVSQKLGTAEKERETLLASNGLELNQQRPFGAALEPLQLHSEPEPEPEPEPVAPALAGSSQDDVFRDGVFAAYLNRVEEKGCAWRQELNRCGIALAFDTAPKTFASIRAAEQLAAAAEGKRAAAAEARRDAPTLSGPAPAGSRGPAASRGKVMVRIAQTAEWVAGEIVSIEDSSRLATVRYGANSTVCVFLTDPTRVRLVPPPHRPDASTH